MLQHPLIERACAIALALVPVSAFCAAEQPEQTLRRITVEAEEDASSPAAGFVAQTATKSDLDIVDVPRAVSVVTADEIRNRAADDLTDIFQYTAGINGDAYGGNSLSRVYSNARGFLTYQYLDGMKLHDSNWGIEPFGLERAELLKGPGSSLYGQGSPGGIINLISKRPSFVPTGELALQVGSHERVQGAFDVAGPLSETVSYRLTALARDAETQIDHTQDDRYYVAPALTWRPSERTELTVLGSFQSDPNLTVFQYLPRVGTLTPSQWGYVPRNTFTGEPGFDDLSIDRTQIGYLLQHRFSDLLSLRHNVRYTDLDITARYLQAGALGADQRTVPLTRVNSGFEIEVFQTDNQLVFDFDTGSIRHEATVGIDYASIPTYQGQGSGAGPTLDLYAPAYGASLVLPPITTARDQDFEQFGIYAQDQLSVGILSLLLGVRRDDASSETKTRNPITGVAAATVKQDDEANSGQAGISLHFANGLVPYANYAKSFQPTAGSDFSGRPFDPSTGEQVEVGLKYRPPGTAMLFTAALFEVVQKNVRTNDLAHPGFAIQTGEVTAKGVEVESKISLAQGLNLNAAYTYLDNEVTRSTTSNLNKAPPGRPEHQASLWADYLLPIVPGLTVGGGVRYVGKSFGDATNTFRVPDYALFDVLLRYELSSAAQGLKGWSVAANASNLDDKRYVVNCDAATQCFYGQGRIARLTIHRRW